MPLFNPLLLVNAAQRSHLVRWLMGLRNFSLMPTRPGEDPMHRMQLRLMTTLSGLLAGLISLIVWAAAGVAAWAAPSLRPTAWTLAVGGGAMLLLALRATLQSRLARMPTPGVLWVTIVLDLAAIATAVWMFVR